MGLNSLISDLIIRLTSTVGALTTSHTPVNMVVTADEPSVEPGPKRGRPPKRPTALNFDLAEAVRLHRAGVGWKKIARRMSNVSWQTVRRRVQEYEATRPDLNQTPMLPQATEPPALAVEVAQQPPAGSSSIQEPAPATVPPLAATALQVPSAVPVTPSEPPPEPVDNGEAILARCPWLKEQPLESRTRRFFLVNANGKLNLDYATNNSQFGVVIERWHNVYRDMPLFQNATKIWVVLDENDDNRAFLQSLIDDSWIREKCVITVGSMLDIAKYKTDARVPYKISFECFEQVWRFSSLPQPNEEERIQQLLRKPTPAPEPPLLGATSEYWRVGGSAASSAHRSSGFHIELPRSGEYDENDIHGMGGLLGT